MTETAKRRQPTRILVGLEQEALLGLLVAAGYVRERVDEVCAEFGLTSGQYNVLRILRGGPTEGCPRCDVAERMLERSPDVTRLLDRLEKQGLVERSRSEADRRLSLAAITPKGLALLERVQPAVERLRRELGERLGAADCRELVRICERIYSPLAE